MWPTKKVHVANEKSVCALQKKVYVTHVFVSKEKTVLPNPGQKLSVPFKMRTP